MLRSRFFAELLPLGSREVVCSKLQRTTCRYVVTVLDLTVFFFCNICALPFGCTREMSAEAQRPTGSGTLALHTSPRVLVPQCARKIPERMNISREAALDLRECTEERIAMQRAVQRLIAVDIEFSMRHQIQLSTGRSCLTNAPDFDTRFARSGATVSSQWVKKRDPVAARPASSSPRNAASAKALAVRTVRRRQARRSVSRNPVSKAQTELKASDKSDNVITEKEPTCTETTPRSHSQSSSRSRSSNRAEDPSVEPL